MITGTTKSGYAFAVSEKVKNNWHFVKAVARAEGGKSEDEQLSGLVDMVRVLLGEQGEESLCAHLVDDEGVVPADRLLQEVREIMAALKDQSKNS